jgi:uncharacterized protein YdhG (YjbR/CyaY superfamily)
MISHAPDVASYVAEVPEERRPAIEKLRSLCRKTLKGYEETIEYGMPCYKRGGVLEVSFASQKQYVALYVMKKEVVDEFRDALPAASIGKGCIRFKKPAAIDFAVVEKLLRRNAESSAAPC